MKFVLFSFGGETYARQSLLAAWSILAHNSTAEVAVYTDFAAVFKSAPVSLFPLCPFDVKAMAGPLEFRHRIKIQILQRHLAEIDDSEPLCYVDSDTYCHQPFPAAEGHQAFMHTREGRVGPKFHTRMHEFFSRSRPLLESAGCADFPEDLEMFNAGLLYLPGTPLRHALLQKVLHLTDVLCLWFPQQMEWLEQAAFSYYLPRHFATSANDCGFIHYWPPNQEVALILKGMPLEEIKALASNKKQFEAICVEAERIGKSKSNKWRQRCAKWRRSIRKRVLIRRAERLRNAQG